MVAYSSAQEVDTTLYLPYHEVHSSKVDEYTAGQKVRSFDSITLLDFQDRSLGELLDLQTAIYIKNYNLNGLNLVSIRGTNSSHTGIYWNGFQLNPPNIGQMDLSLIPSGIFNDISLLYGGNSSLFGSGNIGGSIHLNEEPEFTSHVKSGIGVFAGSFGEIGTTGRITISDGKWYGSTRFNFKQADNDFEYENQYGEKVKFENASLDQFGIMQDFYRWLGKKSLIGISFWYQQNEKEIPASMISKPSDAWQYDQSLRGFISFKNYFNSGFVLIKSAWLHDFLHYLDPADWHEEKIDSKFETDKAITEIQFEKSLFSHSTLSAGTIFTYEQTRNINYVSKSAYQQQLGIYVLWLQKIPSIDWSFSLNMRQDFMKYYNAPLTPSFGLEGKVWKFIHAKLSVSRNFRIPTFNDRFWVPGGNDDLQPEVSWNEEASLIFKSSTDKKHLLDFTITAFNSNVDNWIIWDPVNGLWSPQNLQEVWSRGLESDLKLNLTWGKLKTLINGGYTWVRSTNEHKQHPNDQTYQKQLIYVPEHRVFANIKFLISGFMLGYNHAYTGQRYVTADNDELLNAFDVGEFSVSKKWMKKGHSFLLSFLIANFWDEDYKAVQYYPMPGRNFRLSVNYQFEKYKKAKNEKMD
jgi:iron complex outermembrane receptor protein